MGVIYHWTGVNGKNLYTNAIVELLSVFPKENCMLLIGSMLKIHLADIKHYGKSRMFIDLHKLEMYEMCEIKLRRVLIQFFKRNCFCTFNGDA